MAPNARAVAGQGVGVQRNEKPGAEPAGDFDPLAERDEAVVFAGENHAKAVAFAQFRAQNLGEFEHQEFFHRVVAAQGAGIDAAMAGIEHNERFFTRRIPLRWRGRRGGR